MPILESVLLGGLLLVLCLLGVVLVALLTPEGLAIGPGLMALAVVIAAVVLIAMVTMVWLSILRPLRILDVELGSWRRPAARRTLVHRVLTGARALLEAHQRAELKLEASNENMREAEKLALVGKMAAGMAHSIRNPLTGLKLRLFSLTRGMDLDARQAKHLLAINEAVAHMEKVISNVLEVSRKPRLAKSACDVTAVLDRVLLLLEPRLQAYRTRVERTTAQLPMIEADSEKLCEAFANLVANACEAAGMDGTVTIIEEAGKLAPLDRVVVVRIHDSGPGIPENLRDVIFEPFMSTKKEGTGLGLPIARQVFEEHGGWLNLHCAPGQGATFVCVLPVPGGEDVWLRSS